MRLFSGSLLAALAVLGCVSGGAGGPGGQLPSQMSTTTSWAIAPHELGTQSLFRVQYDGPEGDGGLRLVMRIETSQRFQLSATDSLGRAVWSVDVEPAEAVLVYHREKAYCVTSGEVRLPETALAPLPLRSLPRVLLGDVPVPAADRGLTFSQGGFVDAAGRRWSARTNGEAPTAWTLYDPDGPLLWWTAQGKGGILSHREGVQFRWRRSVRENLTETLSTLPVPAGYERRSCDGSDP